MHVVLLPIIKAAKGGEISYLAKIVLIINFLSGYGGIATPSMEVTLGWIRKKVTSLRKISFLSLSGLGNMKKLRKKWFLKNGGKLLEESVNSCNGKCNPIRAYSFEELRKATNGFKSYCYSNDFHWYKAILDNRPVLIKEYREENAHGIIAYNGQFRDIVISSQMSCHNNALKLLGCCLEHPIPMLVYEFVKYGPLNASGDIAYNGESLSWKIRLNVAKDIANALTYLHTAFPRPIIHRNIKPNNVFLDKNFVAKLSDLSLSIPIPEGKTIVEDEVAGTLGFLDPVYNSIKSITEKTDVYSFGVFLLVLLTGQKAYDNQRTNNGVLLCDHVKDLVEKEEFNRILSQKILEGEWEDNQEHQLQDFLELALRCVENNREDRPLMIDVAKELRRIARSTNHTN